MVPLLQTSTDSPTPKAKAPQNSTAVSYLQKSSIPSCSVWDHPSSTLPSPARHEVFWADSFSGHQRLSNPIPWPPPVFLQSKSVHRGCHHPSQTTKLSREQENLCEDALCELQLSFQHHNPRYPPSWTTLTCSWIKYFLSNTHTHTNTFNFSCFWFLFLLFSYLYFILAQLVWNIHNVVVHVKWK